MPSEPKPPNAAGRVAIIGAVKNPLSFFVLLVLVVETPLAIVVVKGEGGIQITALAAMVLVVAAMIAIVAFFAHKNPGALLNAGPSRDIEEFRGRILGHWWERLVPEEPSAMSFFEVGLDASTNSVKLKGRSFNRNGEGSATWESVATCINPHERKVFYYWKGGLQSLTDADFGGFGELSFDDSPDVIANGTGMFSDANLADLKSTVRKRVEFRRSTADESKVMQGGDGQRIAALIRRKIEKW
jgi:hypothetical protein